MTWNVKWHKMSNDTWYVKRDAFISVIFMLMLMLDLWPQAETPGVPHFGAYHRPLDSNFLTFCYIPTFQRVNLFMISICSSDMFYALFVIAFAQPGISCNILDYEQTFLIFSPGSQDFVNKTFQRCKWSQVMSTFITIATCYNFLGESFGDACSTADIISCLQMALLIGVFWKLLRMFRLNHSCVFCLIPSLR